MLLMATLEMSIIFIHWKTLFRLWIKKKKCQCQYFENFFCCVCLKCLQQGGPKHPGTTCAIYKTSSKKQHMIQRALTDIQEDFQQSWLHSFSHRLREKLVRSFLLFLNVNSKYCVTICLWFILWIGTVWPITLFLLQHHRHTKQI